FRQVKAGSATNKQPSTALARLTHDLFKVGAVAKILQRFLPRLWLREDFPQRGGVANYWVRAIHDLTCLLESAICSALVSLPTFSFDYNLTASGFRPTWQGTLTAS